MAMDRMGDVTMGIRDRMKDAKNDRLDRENDRLRTENTELRSRLSTERDEHEELLSTLKSMSRRTPKRRVGLFRVIILGGGAYLLGARAGRERYEQIMAKARELWNDARGQMSGQMSGSSSTGTGAAATSRPGTPGSSVPTGMPGQEAVA